MIVPPLKNRFVEMKNLDDLLLISYKRNSIIDLRAAKDILQYRIWYQMGQTKQIICDIRKIRAMTRPAREYLTFEGMVLVERMAIVIDHGLTDFMFQAHRRTNGYVVPTVTFTSIEEALLHFKTPQGTNTGPIPDPNHVRKHTHEKV